MKNYQSPMQDNQAISLNWYTPTEQVLLIDGRWINLGKGFITTIKYESLICNLQ